LLPREPTLPSDKGRLKFPAPPGVANRCRSHPKHVGDLHCAVGDATIIGNQSVAQLSNDEFDDRPQISRIKG
jgi:hypothetical protein